MRKFWKVAALVALAAIPLIILGKRKSEEKSFVSHNEDAIDLYERELS